MMYGLIAIGTSSATLILLFILFHVENLKGQRILLPRVRGMLDELVLRFIDMVKKFSEKFGRGFLKSVFNYIIYILLRRIIKALISFEKRLFKSVK